MEQKVKHRRGEKAHILIFSRLLCTATYIYNFFNRSLFLEKKDMVHLLELNLKLGIRGISDIYRLQMNLVALPNQSMYICSER